MPKTVPDALPDLVPSVTVAELLGVDRATISRWAKSGRLPVAVKIPGVRGPNLFRREDVEAALRERQTAA